MPVRLTFWKFQGVEHRSEGMERRSKEWSRANKAKWNDWVSLQWKGYRLEENQSGRGELHVIEEQEFQLRPRERAPHSRCQMTPGMSLAFLREQDAVAWRMFAQLP